MIKSKQSAQVLPRLKPKPLVLITWALFVRAIKDCDYLLFYIAELADKVSSRQIVSAAL